MKINKDTFVRLYQNNVGGSVRAFSASALELIYDFYQECSPESDFDPINISCSFDENSMQEIVNDYGVELDSGLDFESKMQLVIEYLCDSTAYLGRVGDNLVFATF